MGFCGWFDVGGDQTMGSDAIAHADAVLAAMAQAADPDHPGRPDGAGGVHGGGLHGIGLPARIAAAPGAGAGSGADHSETRARLSHGEPDLGLILSDALALADIGDVHALARTGRAAPERLPEYISGPFALALATPSRRLLAIDRAGARALFVWRAPDGRVFFSTRLAALTAAPGFDALIDDQALFDYLYFHMVPSPGSIYRGVTKLLPGVGQAAVAGRATTASTGTCPTATTTRPGYPR